MAVPTKRTQSAAPAGRSSFIDRFSVVVVALAAVIWVSDAYSDHALLPQTPQPFTVALRDDLAANVHSYRVTVNEYSLNRSE